MILTCMWACNLMTANFHQQYIASSCCIISCCPDVTNQKNAFCLLSENCIGLGFLSSPIMFWVQKFIIIIRLKSATTTWNTNCVNVLISCSPLYKKNLYTCLHRDSKFSVKFNTFSWAHLFSWWYFCLVVSHIKSS